MPEAKGMWEGLMDFSFRSTDVLFLIPEPWLAPVWFPLLVNVLALLVVLLARVSPTKA